VKFRNERLSERTESVRETVVDALRTSLVGATKRDETGSRDELRVLDDGVAVAGRVERRAASKYK
jgi:hypothetical protein